MCFCRITRLMTVPGCEGEGLGPNRCAANSGFTPTWRAGESEDETLGALTQAPDCLELGPKATEP